jgi:NAD-dependent deacetylase
MKKKIVVLTGAGVSAESGIKTFRDGDGLWENHRIEDVATPEAWKRNPELVLKFYNQRRRQLLEVQPNEAHKALVNLEAYFDVHIITQNVDDLHERAGSTKVLHLHGELFKVRSTKEPSLVYEWKKDLALGDKCDLGSQLRPHIVWFGEMVPAIEEAAAICSTADIFIIIGTSLQVYPAAGLIHDVPLHAVKYIIDPNYPGTARAANIFHIEDKASSGTVALVTKLINDEQS